MYLVYEAVRAANVTNKSIGYIKEDIPRLQRDAEKLLKEFKKLGVKNPKEISKISDMEESEIGQKLSVSPEKALIIKMHAIIYDKSCFMAGLLSDMQADKILMSDPNNPCNIKIYRDDMEFDYNPFIDLFEVKKGEQYAKVVCK